MREPGPDPGSERLRDGLDELKRSLGAIGSVRPDVERRIADVTVRPALAGPLLVGVAVVALLGIGSALWWRAGVDRSVPPQDRIVSVGTPAAPLPAEPLRLTFGGAEVVAHVAAVVDGRAVLVAWSVRGDATGGIAEEQHRPGDFRAGKYRRRQLPRGTSSDGRAVACSLYVPDAGVHPVLEPPTVLAAAGDGQVVAFSTSPRVAADAELAASLRSLGLSEEAGVSLAGIRQSIRELAQE